MKKIFLALALAVCAFGVKMDSINEVVQRDINKVPNIVSNKKTSLNQKSKALFEMFDGYFDYPLMSRLALGKHAKALTRDELSEFESIFVKRLKESFTDKLSLYTNQKFVISKSYVPARPANRYNIDIDIVSSGSVYKMGFKMHTQKGRDDYKVYDVDVLGISIVNMYRTQFNAIKTGDFQAILSAVKQTDVNRR